MTFKKSFGWWLIFFIYGMHWQFVDHFYASLWRRQNTKTHIWGGQRVARASCALSLSLYGDESVWEGEGSPRSAQSQCVRDSACVQ